MIVEHKPDNDWIIGWDTLTPRLRVVYRPEKNIGDELTWYPGMIVVPGEGQYVDPSTFRDGYQSMTGIVISVKTTTSNRVIGVTVLWNRSDNDC